MHPGHTVEEVQKATGFPLVVQGKVAATIEPTAEQLRIIREEIDTQGVLQRVLG